MYEKVCDKERGSVSGAGRELGAFVVILERETRLEVEGFTRLDSLPVTAGAATLTDFCLPTRLKSFQG
jgi:hypothetical protein